MAGGHEMGGKQPFPGFPAIVDEHGCAGEAGAVRLRIENAHRRAAGAGGHVGAGGVHGGAGVGRVFGLWNGADGRLFQHGEAPQLQSHCRLLDR